MQTVCIWSSSDHGVHRQQVLETVPGFTCHVAWSVLLKGLVWFTSPLLWKVSVCYVKYAKQSYPFLCRENATQPCYTPGNDYDLRKKGTTLVKLLFTTRWEEKAKSQTEEFSSDVFCLSLEFLQELECNAIGPVCRWGCWDTYSGLTSS